MSSTVILNRFNTVLTGVNRRNLNVSNYSYEKHNKVIKSNTDIKVEVLADGLMITPDITDLPSGYKCLIIVDDIDCPEKSVQYTLKLK